MPQPLTGSPCWSAKRRCWIARVTMEDGRREPIPMPDVPPCSGAGPVGKWPCPGCTEARRLAAVIARRVRELGAVTAGTGETVNEWFDRYYDAAERGAVGSKNRGKPQASVNDRRARFRTWISDAYRVLPRRRGRGAKGTQARHERQDGEERLWRGDKWLRGSGPLQARRPSRARSKPRRRRARSDDHRRTRTSGALSVGRGRASFMRARSRLTSTCLLRCTVHGHAAWRTRAARRRGRRPGPRPHHCSRQEDERSAEADPDREGPSAASRLAREDASFGALARRPPCGREGRELRPDKARLRARISRSRGSLARRRDDAHHMPFTFHGLRHTCITHWAIAGRPQTWLLVVAGHTDAEMTRRYLDKAAVVRGRFGRLTHPCSPTRCSKRTGRELGNWPVLHKSKTANPAGLAVFLTSPLRPQRESNPRYRRERPMS